MFTSVFFQISFGEKVIAARNRLSINVIIVQKELHSVSGRMLGQMVGVQITGL